MSQTIKQDIVNYGGIENYLHAQQYKILLRFLTCGGVDDGKSTLIGRLLHDTKHVYDDQLLDLQKDANSVSVQNDKLDLALLVDGLQSEREQGITIDVAYRYFFTKKRKFIIIDTPGHEEYTKNMVTGASHSNLAILLVDARKGIRQQTRRHWFISVLMGIQDIVVAVNKMDLVNYDQSVFQDIKSKYLEFNNQFSMSINTAFIPISALNGDNVFLPSKKMPWYNGSTLFDILENSVITSTLNIDNRKLRFPIQYVIRYDTDFRGYSGTIASGSMHVGQSITVFPSYTNSYIKQIFYGNKDRINALTGEAITVTLTDDIDVSRGDMLIDLQQQPVDVVQKALVDIVWMKKEALEKNQYFDVKITTKIYRVQIKNILYKIDIHTFNNQDVNMIPYNGIGSVEILFEEPLILDQYLYYPVTGSMIFIDIFSNETVGAGMVKNVIPNVCLKNKQYSKFELDLHSLIRFHFPHWNIRDLSD